MSRSLFIFQSKFLIAVGHSEEYSFLMPVLKALLEKSRNILCLSTIVPDLPPTSSGPVFFEEFQMYSGTKQWTSFIEKQVRGMAVSSISVLINRIEAIHSIGFEFYFSSFLHCPRTFGHIVNVNNNLYTMYLSLLIHQLLSIFMSLTIMIEIAKCIKYTPTFINRKWKRLISLYLSSSCPCMDVRWRRSMKLFFTQ